MRYLNRTRVSDVSSRFRYRFNKSEPEFLAPNWIFIAIEIPTNCIAHVRDVTAIDNVGIHAT